MKRKRKRKAYATLAVVLMVSMNINPIAGICGAIADSGVVDRFINFKNNLIYVAENGKPMQVHAEDTTPNINVPVDCDHSDEIDKLMGTGAVTLTDIKKEIGDGVISINGTIEKGSASIVTAIGSVNSTLQSIDEQLGILNNTIRDMQHEYRVAHLYSINNEAGVALWRPYTSDVPYVTDFASVMGQFANVYTGYWDSSVTTVTNPMGARAERALEILGYDAIVRYEGTVLQKTVSAATSTGMSGESVVYSPLDPGKDLMSARTIATVDREEIGTDAVTWLDAVTLLYKALDQEQYTYQSFMSANYEITPETSPAFQGLANPVPTYEPDGSSHYRGYDFKMFLTRSNVITGTAEDAKKIPVYWTKAVSDGFIPARVTMDDEIMASDFLKLAHHMMVAYGEPEMTMDETMALLQVYGTNFPISLGIEIADAWAYLKVRGCLSDSVIAHISSTVSREDLLDICMRIKDEESRLDYKNIDVVLDIGELLRDDGYYPVYDLEFSVGEFSTTIEYDYSEMSSYGYCIAMTNDMTIGTTGKLVICSEPDINKKISGAWDENSKTEIDGLPAVIFTVPKDYRGNIYVASVDLGKNVVVPGAVDWIEIPSTLLGGGLFWGSFSRADKVAIATESSYHPFDHLAADKRFHPYADFERAGEPRPSGTVASLDATVLERWAMAWNEWTSPMEVHAETGIMATGEKAVIVSKDGLARKTGSLPSVSHVTGSGSSGSGSGSSDPDGSGSSGSGSGSSSGSSSNKYGDGISFTMIDTIKHGSGLILSTYPDSGPEITDIVNQGSSNTGLNIADNQRTLYLNRAYLAANYPLLKKALASSGMTWEHVGSSFLVEKGSATKRTAAQVVGTAFFQNTNDKHKDSNGDQKYVHSTTAETQLTDAILAGTSLSMDIAGRKYAQSYDDLPVRWLLGSAPADVLTEYVDKASNVKLNRSLLGCTLGVSNLEAEAEAIRDAFSKMREAQSNDATHKLINQKVSDAVNLLGLQDASYDANTGEYEFTFTKDGGASSFFDAANDFDVTSSVVDIKKSVATSAIMSRKEEKLLSWEALRDAGVVVPEPTGGMPKMQSDGSYHFMTKDGMVKVNPRLSTIQIGTTLYDLAPADGSKGPLLVYIDPDQDNMMYLDVRCVMGLIANDFVRDEEITTQVRNSLGSQGYVVYDIGASGILSPLFEAVDVGCYNFPDVSGTIISGSEGKLHDGTISTSYYTTKIYKSTVYDNQYDIGDTGAKYWPDGHNAGVYNRMGMASFMPTANWITVIDDDGQTTEASLFVYYPKAAFDYGFVNDVGGSIITPTKPANADSYATAVADVSSIPVIQKALDDQYPESERSKWYVQMTYAAVKNLYEMTGKYYIKSDFVIREYKLTNNTYDFVEAYGKFDSTEARTDGAGLEIFCYKDAGNSPGAAYWLEGIGFVYNIPKASEFSLKKYFDGEYMLPLALANDSTTSTSKIGVINYNMNYWGTAVLLDNQNGAEVPYGYTLTPVGYVHYKDTSALKPYNVGGTLPKKGDKDASGFELLPFRSPVSDYAIAGKCMQLAPCGVYFYFGGNTMENVPPNAVTQTATAQNQFFYGSNRVTFNALDNDQTTSFNIVSSDVYNPIQLNNNQPFYRVYRTGSYDILINNGVVSVGSMNGIDDVVVDDYVTGYISPAIDGLASTSLIQAIDEGSSLLIVIAFKVLPMIGFILMTILIGLAFISNVKIVQVLCDKFIDPVKVLTFGVKDIHHWPFNRVIVPCILMFSLFAIFLNGNIIRLISWLAEWYGVVMKYGKNLF